MKFQEKAAANGLAAVGAAYYIVCGIAVYMVPELYKTIAISWAHGADLAQIWKSTPPQADTVLWGFLTFTAASWITGYFIARSYNYFAGKK